jgi:hypothetical protein
MSQGAFLSHSYLQETHSFCEIAAELDERYTNDIEQLIREFEMRLTMSNEKGT